MAGGLVALLDDVAAIAKLAAGVVIDDTAVTPRYVVGLAPQRELPIIGKIVLGSLRNKLLFLLPTALLLSAFAPWAITPILMLGGAFLCFEASEKIVEMLAGGHAAAEDVAVTDPKVLEDRQQSNAYCGIRILEVFWRGVAFTVTEVDGMTCLIERQ